LNPFKGKGILNVVKRLSLTLCLLLITSRVFSQESKLLGQVVDAGSRNPLKSAEVYLAKSQEGTVTDSDGYFVLERETIVENDTLVVSFIGYREYRSAIKDFENMSRIDLQPVSIELQDSVLVRADRINLVKQEIPHSRSVIDYKTIEIRGSSEISDFFKTIPAVRVEGNDLTGRRIQIRGSNAEEVNVYIDGTLINNLGEDNAADLSIIATENIEKMEVLKGANLTLLGSGAFGGVVNITTRKSLDKSLLLKTKQGSFDTQYYIGEINFPITNRFVLNYFGQYNGIKPGIEYFPGESTDTVKTENETIESIKQNHNVTLNYYLGGGKISTRFYGYLFDYEKLSQDNQPLKNFRKNFLFSGSYTGSLLGIHDLDFRFNYLLGEDERRRDRISENSLTDRFTDSFQTDRINVKILKRFIFGYENEFQFLGEYVHDEITTDIQQNINGVNRSVYNALLYENRWSFAGVAAFSNRVNDLPTFIWKTHIGLRDDLVATGENYFSPTMGIQLEYTKSAWILSPYINYGKNVKFQNLLDNAFLALQEISGEDTTLTRLAPEESNAGEFGFGINFNPASRHYQDIDFKFSIFRNVVFNKLVRILSFGTQEYEQAQIGRNITKGMEASLGVNKFHKYWDFIAAATLLNIEYPSLYPFKPENLFSFQMVHSANWGGYFSFTYFYEGQSTGLLFDERTGFRETVNINPFFDFDASIGYRFRVGGVKLNLQAAGYNILDNSGFQFYLLKKQYFQVSLSAKI
jgi:outer membrane receptor protein involved in Fe transport